MYILLLFLLQAPLINEVMEDPLGPESGSFSAGDCNEFVEIFNKGPDTVDMSKFFISDEREVDSIVAFDDSSILDRYPDVFLETKVPPLGYALVLDREYTLAESSVLFPYEIRPGVRLLTTKDSNLGNGLSNGEKLFLIRESGDTVSIFPGLKSQVEGVSLERRDEGAGSLWLPSRWGSSPGGVNSWSLKRELALLKELEVTPKTPNPTDSVSLTFFVANLGIEEVVDGVVGYRGNYVEGAMNLPSIGPLDTLPIDVNLGYLPEGLYRVTIFLKEADDDPTDDTVTGVFRVGQGGIVINEIMFDSPVEWIELFNPSKEEVSLKDVVIEDASGSKSEPVDLKLKGHGYSVLTGDPEGFRSNYPGITPLEVKKMPTLNNDGDTLYIEDKTGLIIESVCYKRPRGIEQGTSIERVSADAEGCIRGNWKPSIDPTGSTPGGPNSVSFNYPNDQGELHLSEKVFSPRSGEILEVGCRVPFSPSKVTLMIFDITGRMIWKKEDELDTENGLFLWDGKDRRGIFTPTGLYILLLQAEGKKGNVWKVKRTLVVREK